ncbi:unnamed protein product [Vitrella brassicaformis CCMP3155]|uniref:Uncharacterized protein n=1 Tax=Vitrella brassicaformis (strain CCMP3155) TaxID=1169540 RepID=A0A0G4FRG5_VITBC|nr:unnamed protein product [Vitrella brassicaformis CCMP3155]|eukprot:CEM16839.1 unnamed protein product [Vitrella brassicaformis CCMP3155]
MYLWMPQAEDDQSAQTTPSGTMISKLCTDASLLREGLQRLQRDAQQSREACQRDGGGVAEALLSSVVSQVSVAEASMAGAMDSLTATAAIALPQPMDDVSASAAAAAAAAVAMEAPPEEPNAESSAVVEEEEAAPTPSFRLVHTSGKPPPNSGPPSLRLSPDELACVFGFYQPSELTRVATTIGKTVFGWAAKRYTHLTIDGSDKGGVRQQWERMPLEVAHRWGQRATNLTHLHVIYKNQASRWCRGTWVALIDGNAAARKAMSREREGQCGAAAAARGPDRPSAASSIKVLSFEEDSDGEPYDEGEDVSSAPLPPSPLPVDLSVLEEVHDMPYACAAVRMGDRVWQTPSMRVMTLKQDECDAEAVMAKWMASCEHLEVFDDGSIFEITTELLTMPPPGTSLVRLRSMGTLNLDTVGTINPGRVADLRQALVARGCHMSLRELPIEATEITAEHKGLLREVPSLSAAVLQPEALSQPQVVKKADNLEMELELIEWMAEEAPQVQKLVREFAAVTDVVFYKNELTDPNAAGHAAAYFPRATTFRCNAGQLPPRVRSGLAKTVANMPQCNTIEFVDNLEAHQEAPKNAVAFLESLKRHMATGKGPGAGEGGDSTEGATERSLSVQIEVSANGILHHSRPLQKWASHDLPAIDEVTVFVMDGLEEDDSMEALYGSVMASLVGIMSRPGVSKASIVFLSLHDLGHMRRLFQSQLAWFNLLDTPYTITMEEVTITVETRT